MAKSYTVAETAKIPLWLWPNVLSLDAPVIASVWQALFAARAGVTLSTASRAALPLAVWVIYLVDRLLDTSGGMPLQRTTRHGFYCAHRRFCYLLTGFAIGLLSISVFHLPAPVLKGGAAVSGLVGIYLLAVHWQSKKRFRKVATLKRSGLSGGKWLPKEQVVSVVFAAGTVLAPFTMAAHERPLVFPALLFGLVCWLNCSAIEVWGGGRADRLSAWLVRYMKAASLVGCVLSLWLGLATQASQPLALALFLSAIGLWAIANRHAEYVGEDALRVLVDLPLLAPLLLIGLR